MEKIKPGLLRRIAPRKDGALLRRQQLSPLQLQRNYVSKSILTTLRQHASLRGM